MERCVLIDKDTQRALRIRDTKRRQRARQKEYTTELEQRLRALEAQGVQATVEVQISARGVAKDNERLRRLLRTIGVDEDVINGWNEGQEVTYKTVNLSKPRNNETIMESQRKICSGGPCKSNTTSQVQPTPPPAECKSNPPTPPAPCQSKTPCKLARALAADPHTDITQLSIPAANSEADEETASDKTPCAKAAQMLLQFATSDEKLQALAGILDEGCVQNGKGGCSVKNKVMLEALDGVCM
ncbi:hypothetical protein L873DRAFT_1687529 [Choiromyces venosus 120613-1]|uniref:BZIP domain-containing protein n=1 Tax=Choiromyces venosus 120613-1 TaxID=1336337 RepID=A0A3N4JJE7_9PEZI|nr:hypothetical protein L873DRAFT_1687529 [Choiromyces venosus 120613-1]